MEIVQKITEYWYLAVPALLAVAKLLNRITEGWEAAGWLRKATKFVIDFLDSYRPPEKTVLKKKNAPAEPEEIPTEETPADEGE